jgi:hypothetical protein
MAYDVFISYASVDVKYAQELNDHLVKEGVKVWYDKARLSPGCDWHKEIEQGCENSRVVLPVMTPNWKNSEWTKFETYGAESVVPILFESSWDEVSTPPLERFHAEVCDMQKTEGPDWDHLISSIRRVCNSPLPEKINHLTHIHYRANEYFTGREKELIQIHEELHSRPQPGLTSGRVRAIAAMGGAGKTTLVRQYVEKFWKCYNQMFWIDCRLGFESEFAHIHDILFPEKKDLGLKDADKAIITLHELNSDISRLLILDNADGLEESVFDWMPQTGACHTLITSRFGAFGASIKTIYIFLLEKKHSIEFLRKRIGRNIDDSEIAACEALVEELNYLPLALEQAAAYIEQQGKYFGFADYLLLYKEAKEELLGINLLGSNIYPDSVMTTWRPTISKLSPIGRSILHLSSYMAPIQIQIECLLKASDIICEHAEKFYGGVNLKNNIKSLIGLRNELADLKAYSMIQYDGQSYSMHPLVQIVERYYVTARERDYSLRHVIKLIERIAPPSYWEEDSRKLYSLANEQLWSQILKHVINIEQLVSIVGDKKRLNAFYYLSMNAYASNGFFDRALELCSSLIKKPWLLNKSANIEYLKVLKAFAYLKKHKGLNLEALECFTELYHARVKIYGKKSAFALYTKHVMAILMHLLGQTIKAEKTMNEVLADQLRVLGENDYETIVSFHNIGWLLFSSESRWREAEPFYRNAYKFWEKTVGIQILDTRIAAENLAILLFRKGELVEAESVQTDLLTKVETHFGKEHLVSIGIKRNLIRYVYYNGKFEEAHKLINEVVEGYRKNLPANHHDLVSALDDLSVILIDMNRNEDAEMYLRDALAGYEKTQTTNSDDTLRTVRKLADLLDKIGRYSESKLLHKQIIVASASKKEITPLQLRESACASYKIGDYDFAEELLLRVLSEHYEIPGTHCHLARIYILTDKIMKAQDNIVEAQKYLSEAPQYVIARILWFKVLFGFLNSFPAEEYVSQLKMVLQNDSAFKEWDMKPVLMHLKPQLKENQYALLSVLVAALCSKKNLSQLENLKEWSNIKLLSVD